MRSNPPKAQKIALIGGGHTHALVLRSFAMKPVADVQFTLINPSPKAPYTGMLPGYVAGHYTRRDVEIDLMRLARNSGAQLILDTVTGMDPLAKTISLQGREPISYDIASINVGITSHLPNIPGFNKFGHPAKPLGEFAKGWSHFLNTISNNDELPQIAVIGAGVAGVELALSMSHRLHGHTSNPAKITILERSDQILKGTSAKTKQILMDLLAEHNITVRTDVKITQVDRDRVTFEDRTSIESHFTVGAAGATPHSFLEQTGLTCQNGFITVDDTLTTSNPTVFAAGDCVHFSSNPLPKAGVFAVRQAPILHNNLIAALKGARRTPYKPQKNYLKLISTGSKSAVADTFGTTLNGHWAWRLKDHIDRKFMKRLADAPEMTPTRTQVQTTATPKELEDKYAMMCGGCGAKMDSRHLTETLSKQPAKNRDDVLSQPGDDAAILRHGAGFQVLTTDHLRSFTNDPWTLGRVAAIHAMGDIWAMGAAPQAAVASIILPPMADHLHAAMLDEVLSAATQALTDAGADLVGGHTSVGSELTVGFSITGLTANAPIKNAGAVPGDVLVMTKPLGVGTILAAEMRGLADGYDVQTAYAQMMRSSQKAAKTLSRHAHAMTDITGFGLAGHLMQMMQASGTQAVVKTTNIPVLEPAIDLARQGIKSSLWASNRAALPDLADDHDPRNALLFDPQTAGGLLAAIPKEHADKAINDLQSEQDPATIIGEIVAGAPSLRLD